MVKGHGSQESISEFHGLVNPGLLGGLAASHAHPVNSLQGVKRETWCSCRANDKLSACHRAYSDSSLVVAKAHRIVDTLYR